MARSNANYLFGNDLSGSPENGIDVLTSSSTLIQGNSVHANFQGGIWIANVQFAARPNAPVPQDTVIQGNNIFFNTQNAQVNLEGALNVEVAYNYLSGAEAGTLAGNSTGGIHIHEGGDAARGVVGSTAVSVFENIVTDVSNRAIVYGTTTNSLIFRNRFLNGSNDPNAPGGRQGITYSIPPAGVQWHAGAFLGGNHWSEFTAATGNPDGAHPYSAFIGNTGGGPYVDGFPYQSEGLATAYARYSVETIEPIGGSVLAAGTKKTIRWVARGCVLVDLYARVCRRQYADRVTVSERRTLLLDRAGRACPQRLRHPGRVSQFQRRAGRAGRVQPSLHHRRRRSRAAEPGPGLPCGRMAEQSGSRGRRVASVARVNIFIKSGSGAETLARLERQRDVSRHHAARSSFELQPGHDSDRGCGQQQPAGLGRRVFHGERRVSRLHDHVRPSGPCRRFDSSARVGRSLDLPHR